MVTYVPLCRPVVNINQSIKNERHEQSSFTLRPPS